MRPDWPAESASALVLNRPAPLLAFPGDDEEPWGDEEEDDEDEDDEDEDDEDEEPEWLVQPKSGAPTVLA